MMLKEVREPIFARINSYREYYLQSDVSKRVFIWWEGNKLWMKGGGIEWHMLWSQFGNISGEILIWSNLLDGEKNKLYKKQK